MSVSADSTEKPGCGEAPSQAAFATDELAHAVDDYKAQHPPESWGTIRSEVEEVIVAIDKTID